MPTHYRRPFIHWRKSNHSLGRLMKRSLLAISLVNLPGGCVMDDVVLEGGSGYRMEILRGKLYVFFGGL